ncbi:MAG: DUF3307 domain-containing protein [Chitinophagaceae bacterium]
MEFIWLTKIILAHLLTDFILQPTSWIVQRKQKHFRSWALYLHTILTAAVAWLLIGWQYWYVALIIFVTHTLIDGWKSYQRDRLGYFLADQLFHFLVIIGCWYFIFFNRSDLVAVWSSIATNTNWWIKLTAFVFLTWPAGILIGQLTMRWREKLENPEALSQAGKWIGIIERMIILIFVLNQQYFVLGLLVAAKALLRFNEKDRAEQKTEYLLIGTLISIGLALTTGLMVIELTR